MVKFLVSIVAILLAMASPADAAARRGSQAGVYTDPYACSNPARDPAYTWCTGDDGWTVLSGTPIGDNGTCNNLSNTTTRTCVVYVDNEVKATFTGSISANVLTFPAGTPLASNYTLQFTGAATGTSAPYLGTQIDSTTWNVTNASGVTVSNVSITAVIGNDATCKSYPLPVTDTPALPCLTPVRAQISIARQGQFPDWVLLRRGRVFAGAFNGLTNGNIGPQGKSKYEPFVLSAYGPDGARPVFDLGSSVFGAGGSTACIAQISTHGQSIAVVGVECRGSFADPTSSQWAGAHIRADVGVRNCGPSSVVRTTFTGNIASSVLTAINNPTLTVGDGLLYSGSPTGTSSIIVSTKATNATLRSTFNGSISGGVLTFPAGTSLAQYDTIAYSGSTTGTGAPYLGAQINSTTWNVNNAAGITQGTISMTATSPPTYNLLQATGITTSEAAITEYTAGRICNIAEIPGTGGSMANVGAIPTAQLRFWGTGFNGLTVTTNNYAVDGSVTLSSNPTVTAGNTILAAQQMELQINHAQSLLGVSCNAINHQLCIVEDVKTFAGIAMQPQTLAPDDGGSGGNANAINRIRRNVVAYGPSPGGAGGLGVFAADDSAPNVFNELKENIMLSPGWRPDLFNSWGTVFAHGYYLHGNNNPMLFTGNMTALAIATCAQVRNGGVVYNNLCARDPIGLNINPGNQNNSTVASYNAIVESNDIVGGFRTAFADTPIGDTKLYIPGATTSSWSGMFVANRSNPGSITSAAVVSGTGSVGDGVTSPHAVLSVAVAAGIRGDGVKAGDIIVTAAGRTSGIALGPTGVQSIANPVGLKSTATFSTDGSSKIVFNDSVSRAPNDEIVVWGPSVPAALFPINRSETFYCVMAPGGTSYNVYLSDGSKNCNGGTQTAVAGPGTGSADVWSTKNWMWGKNNVSITVPGSGVAPIVLSDAGSQVTKHFTGEPMVFVSNGDTLPVDDDTGQPLQFMTTYFITNPTIAATDTYGISKTVGGPTINVRSTAISGTHIRSTRRFSFVPGYEVPQWAFNAFNSGKRVYMLVLSGTQFFGEGATALPDYPTYLTYISPDRLTIETAHPMTGISSQSTASTMLVGDNRSGGQQFLVRFYTDPSTTGNYGTTQAHNNVLAHPRTYKQGAGNPGFYAMWLTTGAVDNNASGNYYINWISSTTNCNNTGYGDVNGQGWGNGTGVTCVFLDQGPPLANKYYDPAKNAAGVTVNFPYGDNTYPMATASAYDATINGSDFNGTLMAIPGNVNGGWKLVINSNSGSRQVRQFDQIIGTGVPSDIHVVFQLSSTEWLIDQTLSSTIGPVQMKAGNVEDLFKRAVDNQRKGNWDPGLTAAAINRFIFQNAGCSEQSTPKCYLQ